MAELAEIQSGWRRSPWRLAVWGVAGLLLLVPAVAMQLTDEVKWDAADFITIGAMLFGAAGAFELAARASASLAYRAGAGVAIAAAFLLIWINLAVGIIGSENNPANLMFAGVLAVALAGAVIGRFRPRGMARAMVAAALAQAAVAAIALAAGLGATEPPGPIKLAILISVFAGLWLLSAALFGKAAREAAAL